MASPRNQALTSRQKRVLDYIVERHQAGDIPPTVREIQSALGFPSNTSAVQFVRALEKKGAIQIKPGKARGILPVLPAPASPSSPDRRSLFIDVQLSGDIVAGMPVDADAQEGIPLRVNAKSMGLTESSKPFALRARGTSMIGRGILDGDYIVLDAAREPRPGDVVAALLDGQSTLKTLVEKNGKTFLRAENPKFKDLKPKAELKVQGVMVGLIRAGL